MSSWLSRLDRNRRLALLALFLGVGAVVLGDPFARGRIVIDERELAAIVEGELDHVSPAELADWIVEGRQDFRLIDLRDEEAFAGYHIPQAERIPITALADSDLSRDEKIVLYSDEGIHSAQAWFLFKAKRYPAVYILLGGLSQWNEQILFPIEPAASAPPADRIGFARAAERARSFGGAPRAAVEPGATGAPVAMSTPAPVRPPAALPAPATSRPAGKKNKKEGC